MKYDLNRFITAQKESYACALKEIKAGFKRFPLNVVHFSTDSRSWS